MNFSPIKVPSKKNLKKYFIDNNLGFLVKPSEKCDRLVNEMHVKEIYKPELNDLYLLHQYTLKYKRTTILEIGTGWSTYIFAHALNINMQKYSKDIKRLRRNNHFEVHVVDDEKKFISKARSRIPKNLQKRCFFHFSKAQMTTFNDRICTEYLKLPLINPDLIYLDGPDQFKVKKNINGINIRHKDMMPMSSDILKIEHFLTPGTIIVTDGRAANARFLKANLQRDWKYFYDDINDQSLFFLKERPLGIYNKRQLDFYKK
mgnify:FL=1